MEIFAALIVVIVLAGFLIVKRDSKKIKSIDERLSRIESHLGIDNDKQTNA
ncbi:hypothetical protein ACE3MC_09400 [Enterobacter hormaechei subsp. steigerwaltii]